MKKPKPCDETLQTLENTREMLKTLACGSSFLHFLRVLKYQSCFITVVIHGIGFFICEIKLSMYLRAKNYADGFASCYKN